MNELNAKDISQMTTALSSTPQVQSQKPQADVRAKAEIVETSGKELPTEQAKKAEAKSVEVKEAVTKLNDFAQKTQRDLNFKVDEDSGKTVIKVYDRQSEQLVRQIPNEEALEMAKRLSADEPSMLFSAQV
ncbi:MAG: flagellar protein FlaG [Bermanella sp.]|jgi:flagellar protein FlaG